MLIAQIVVLFLQAAALFAQAVFLFRTARLAERTQQLAVGEGIARQIANDRRRHEEAEDRLIEYMDRARSHLQEDAPQRATGTSVVSARRRFRAALERLGHPETEMPWCYGLARNIPDRENLDNNFEQASAELDKVRPGGVRLDVLAASLGMVSPID